MECRLRGDITGSIAILRTAGIGAQATPLTATGMIHLGRQATTAYIS
jgi:hypothetical protein